MSDKENKNGEGLSNNINHFCSYNKKCSQQFCVYFLLIQLLWLLHIGQWNISLKIQLLIIKKYMYFNNYFMTFLDSITIQSRELIENHPNKTIEI